MSSLNEESCCDAIRWHYLHGVAGLQGLRRTLPSIFVHYQIQDPSRQQEILRKAGLTPTCTDLGNVTFDMARAADMLCNPRQTRLRVVTDPAHI